MLYVFPSEAPAWTGPTWCSAHSAGRSRRDDQEIHGRPALPPKAKAEILEVLFANMEISGDEIAAILKKHHVSCDADVLQDRYRRQLGQRLMASLRDASGEREVLSNGRGGMLCWSAAGIANSSRPSVAAFKIRRMA